MVVLRGWVLLLAAMRLPGVVDGWNLSKTSGPLFDLGLYVAVVELALAAVVALACGVMLLVAGVISTGDLRDIPQKLRRSRPVLISGSNSSALQIAQNARPFDKLKAGF